MGRNKCDVCVISYKVSANLTTHNRKIHKLNECKICKIQIYGDNEFNDHEKKCRNKRDTIRMENDKKEREIKKTNNNYKNAFTILMDETTAKIEKITEIEKQNNIEKENRKIAKEKLEAEDRVELNTKKMEDLFNEITKEERIELETERANRQKQEQDLKRSLFIEKNRIKTGAELKKYKETKLNKNLKVEIQIVRTTAQRRRMMEAYRKLMKKIIDNSTLKKKDELEFIKLCQDQINHVATKSNLLDWNNKVIMLLRGESVLTWYTPCDKTKDKEPWLDLRLTEKWLPQRTSVQKELLKDERQKGAIKILGEDPIEREKRRKQLNQEKIMRVIKNVPVKVYTCNARNANEKMEVVASDGQKFKTDVIHLGEAGVGPNKARDLSGYTTLELARSGPNRGSVMYVKKYLYDKSVRIYDKDGDEEKKGAEIIQLLINSVPKTSIYGVYMETGKDNEDKAHAHQRLTGRVEDDIKNGYNVLIMGDFNTPLNDPKNQKPNLATDLLLEWEESGDIRILNNKEIPTRKPDNTTHKANCLDIMAISKGLEKKYSNYQLDTEQEWSPATVQAKFNVNLNTEVYLRNKSTDHKAQKVTLHMDLIENGNKGNRAIIDYNNSEGWKKYYNVSDRYAGPIIKIIRIYNDKDDLQREFKKIYTR